MSLTAFMLNNARFVPNNTRDVMSFFAKLQTPCPLLLTLTTTSIPLNPARQTGEWTRPTDASCAVVLDRQSSSTMPALYTDDTTTSEPQDRIRVPVSILPFEDNVTFHNSMFFTQKEGPHTLPTPAEVRAASYLQHKTSSLNYRPQPVRFSPNLLVKYGRIISIAEGQCLWMISRLLRESVPVPEIYGWCRDGNEVFIYMQDMQGTTLEERWDGLTADEKTDFCLQLRPMIEALGRLEQEPTNTFIGHIGGQPLLDIIFECHTAGPFPNVKEFLDWYSSLTFPSDAQRASPNMLRQALPNAVPIKFTHSDLHPRNIIVSQKGEGNPRVLAIVDWHQSGWFPAFWESFKTRWSAEIGGEWERKYIPMFVDTWNQYRLGSPEFMADLTSFALELGGREGQTITLYDCWQYFAHGPK